MDLLVEEGDLDLHAEDLVAEGVEAHGVGELERLPVVLERVLGLRVDVGVVEGAAQLGGHGLRVGFEVADDVVLVDEVDPDEGAHAESYSGMVLGEGEKMGGGEKGGKRST